MQTFKKIMKRLALTLAGFLLLLVLAGLSFRLLNTSPQPSGNLVSVNGKQMHLVAAGEKSEGPTLVIEAGSGMSSEYYHWLSEGLKDSIRVLRYDRAGIGHSEESNTPRDSETIAQELHQLLVASGEEPPYVLAGHSIGGPHIRVFADLYPEEVVGLVFLDATHPERVERLNLPDVDSPTYKRMIWTYDALSVLGDLGLVGVYDQLFGPMLAQDGLPDWLNDEINTQLHSGKLIRTARDEMKSYHSNLKRSGVANDFGSLPISVFAAAVTLTERRKAYYEERGEDPIVQVGKIAQMQEDFAQLSTNSTVAFIDGGHNSIYTDKENAAIICQGILDLVRLLSK